MGLKFERTNTMDKLFAKFAADPDDPNTGKLEEKVVRKEADGIDLPEVNKNNEVDPTSTGKRTQKTKNC